MQGDKPRMTEEHDSPLVCTNNHDTRDGLNKKLESYDIKPEDHNNGNHKYRIHVYICTTCGQTYMRTEKVEILTGRTQVDNPFGENAWERHV